LAPTAARPRVWGVLMETGYAEGGATLVVFAEGTTSLYFSNGGGIIGAGEHAIVRTASESFLSTAEANLAAFGAALATPPPEVGRVRFYLRTFQGTLGTEAKENDLGEGRHPLSPLFHAGHAVITAIRQSTPSQ
jgi:hypothetical protein